ncbi:Proclotting enzyme [Folsomia candida]|uniref:Proclotting enzyme n=1 Tax=Folsomia candida TaxID=158441 RepID=A0A226DD96_FOLCA|nr:Proclotting enzyme [Folsomia candida]
MFEVDVNTPKENYIRGLILQKNLYFLLSQHSDIGMMYLSEPVKWADNIAPICLSEGEIPFDDGSSYGILTGWGQPAEGKPSSDTLMKAHLRIWRNDECAEKYKGKIPGGGISNKMVCAGSIAPTLKDACKGDSGAPLSLVRNGRMEQVGIVSFGIGCGQYPGVFSKIPDYLDWIEKHRMRSSKYFESNKKS